MDDMPDSNGQVKELERQVEILKKEADKLTRFLCMVVPHSIDHRGIEKGYVSEECHEWYKAHVKADEKRREEEQKLREWAAAARARKKAAKEAKEHKEYERLKKKYGKEKK